MIITFSIYFTFYKKKECDTDSDSYTDTECLEMYYEDFHCPPEDGFYRCPENPHKFYECIEGMEYLFTCPANLLFNESKQKCDYVTGPIVVRTTKAPATPEHGTRPRHTEPNTKPDQYESTTIDSRHSTRGRHHED